MALPKIKAPQKYLHAPVAPTGITPPMPPKLTLPEPGRSIGDFSPPTFTNPFKTSGIHLNNIASNNMATDSPYFTYAMKAELSKLRPKNTLTEDLERRKLFMFDYNNPNQVNSYADVIMRTAVNIGESINGIDTWANTATELVSDISNIITEGFTKPFQHGFKEGEWDILLNNQLVNFSETVDLVDGIYKAFVINGGLEDFDKGFEGVKRAVIDRENFDFDTGNKVRDLALEMLTPTNILLLIGTLGVGSLGKAAGKEAAEEVGTKVLKSFARSYKGDIGKAILKMPYKFTDIQTKALTEIATHKMNLRLIQTLNKARGAVDMFDSIAPRLAIRSTIGIPWMTLKGTYRMTDHMTRYLMHQVETVVTAADTFLTTFKKLPELEFVVKNIGEAARIVDEKVPDGIPQYALRGVAIKESKALKKLRREFSSTTPSDKLIREYMAVVQSKTGALPGYDVAIKDLVTSKYDKLFASVDAYISEVTGGLYKTFDDYNVLVTKLSGISNISDEVKELHDVVKQLEVDRIMYETMKYQEPLTVNVKAFKSLIEKLETNTLEEFDLRTPRRIELEQEVAGLEASIKQRQFSVTLLEKLEDKVKAYEAKVKLLDEREAVIKNTIANFDESDEIAKVNKTIAAINNLHARIKAIDDLLEKRSKEFRKSTKDSYRATQLELRNQIAALRKAPAGVGLEELRRLKAELETLRTTRQNTLITVGKLNKHVATHSKVVNETLPNLVTKLNETMAELGKYDSIIFPEQMFEDSMQVALDALETLKVLVKTNLEKTSVNYARDVQVTYDTFIKDMQGTILQNYAELKSKYNAMTLKDFQDAMVVWKSFLGDMTLALAEKPTEILSKYALSGKINSLVQAMYGGDILNVIKNLVSDMSGKLSKDKQRAFRTKIDDTILENGQVNLVKIKEIDNILATIEHAEDYSSIFEKVTTDIGDAGTLSEIALDLQDAMARVLEIRKILQEALQENTTKAVNSELIEDLYDSLVSVRHSLDNGLKGMEREKLFSADGDVHPVLHTFASRRDAEFPSQMNYTKLNDVTIDERLQLRKIRNLQLRRKPIDPPEETIDVRKLRDSIQEFEELFEFSADEILEYAENAAKVYSFKVNATARNLHILQNADISELLDAIATRNWSEIPALETLNAISNWDTAAIRKIKVDLGAKNVDGFGIIRSLKDLGFNPGTNNFLEIQQDVTNAVDMIIDAQNAAREMMDTLHGMVSVRQLYANIKTQVDLGLDKGVANHLMDAIQRLYDKPPLLVTAAEEAKYPGILNYRIKEVVDNVENQLRGEGFQYNVKLNTWRDRVRQLVETDKLAPKALEEYDALFGGTMMEHTAIADAYSEYLIHKYVFNDADIPGVKSIYVDVEGSGLNLNTSALYQMSMVIPETNELVWFINKGVRDADLPTSDDVYYLLFGDKHRATYSIDELKDMFKKIYQEGNIDLLKDHFKLNDKIRIVVADDEADMLRKFQKSVADQKPPVGKLQYRIHNGLEYDVPLINNRAKTLGVDRNIINAFNVDDTKIRLEDKFGIKRLTQSELASIENIIFDYLRHRRSEITALMEMRTVAGTDLASKISSNINVGTFLPTMDSSFKLAYDKFRQIFDPADTSNARKVLDLHYSTGTENLIGILDDSLETISDVLKELGTLEKELGKYSIDIIESDLDLSKRLLPAGHFDNVPKGDGWHLANNNVGVDMSYVNTINGVYVPIIGVKRALDTNKTINYFDTRGQKVSTRVLRSMSELSDDISRTYGRIKTMATLDDVAISEFHNVQTMLIDELKKVTGNSLFNPVFTFMKKHDSPVTQFAQLHLLYRRYINMASASKTKLVDVALPDKTILHLPEFIAVHVTPANGEIFRYLDKPDMLLNKLTIDYDDPARFHTLGSMSGDAEEVIKALNMMTNMAMDTLQDVSKVQGQLKFTRMQRLLPLYKGMTDTFNKVDEVVTDVLLAIEKGIADGTIPKSEATVNYRSKLYNRLRVLMEAPDAILSYQKVKWFMEMTPEDMLSYVRHQAKGVVIFNNDSLMVDTYFPMRNGYKLRNTAGLEKDLLGVYDNLYKNKKAYEDLGLTFSFEKGHTAVYIKESDMERLATVPYKRLTQDFDISSYIDDIFASGMFGDSATIHLRNFGGDKVHEILTTMMKTRNRLTSMAVDANTSTLEILDETAMSEILKRINLRAPGVVNLDTMKHYGFFDDNHFNHSVLGHIDNRRELMQYASFNPAKTMFHAVDMLEKQLDVQVQFIELMQTPEYMIKNMTGMTDKEILKYLKENPHLRVAFLNGNSKGTDFKLATITMQSKKDVAFARTMNAVVVDKDVYTTAYSVINRYRLPTRTLRFLDRLLVAPFKIGWLAWNFGVVFRNIFDTDIKNIVALKDITTQRQAAEMVKDWYNYNNAKNSIYKYAIDKKIKIEPAIEHYFSQPTTVITKDMYDMIAEYERAGGTMGKVREAQKYYGDAVDRMYRKIGERNSGVDIDQFKELLKMSDDTAELWLKEQLLIPETNINLIMDTKRDLLNYKRAYEMHKMYKGQDITLDKFFTYIKSGRVPPEHVVIFKKLMEETKGVKAEADILQRALDHPLISNSMKANLQSEEILRLTMYKNLKMKGWSSAQIMAEIERVHFNYDKKNRAQILLEMIMPFSTFRTNSIIFWSEEMLRNHHLVELVGDTWAATSGFKDRELDDVLLRRSLRYQMYTGNLILNEDTGFTMKLNPSVVDMMNFYASPADYLMDSFHSAGKSVYEFLTMEQEEWQSDEDFRRAKQYHLLNLLPFIGSHLNRFNTNMYHSDNKAGLAAIKTLALSPLFNTTWTPAQSTYVPYEKKDWYPVINNRPKYNYTEYSKKYRPKYTVRYGYRDWSKYSTFNRMYYGAQFKFRRGSAYPTKVTRSLNTAFSDMWRRSMTKKGNPKYRFLSFPTNKWTRDLKINMLRNITSYNRWQ